MAAPARDAAFRALRAVAAGRGDLGDALSRARDPLTDPRDRALATDLATGTLRWRSALDYQLQLRSTKPLDQLDAAVLDALRLGAYQLLHLSRVPVSAAVNDSVDLVRRSGFRSATGFANAVLRRLARERETLVWPDRADLAMHLAVVHSHPVWLVRRWLERYGDEVAEQWVRFNNIPPALTLAANRLRTSRAELIQRLRADGVDAVATPTAPHGVIVADGRALTSRAFLEGYCVVQDEASQLIPELVQAASGARVLDVCASPGGKTIALAAQATRQGLVVATDVRSRRVRLLAETLARCRASHVRVVHVPSDGALPFRDGVFTDVLIDAPCSGLGTIRRDPDIRWRRDPTQLAEFARSQLGLLRRAQPLLAQGGRLVYSTCSSEPEENEQVVARFLADAREFVVRPLAATDLPAAMRALATPEGYLRTSPPHGLEAFFGAILERRGPA
jgi:16S rRNA (cytosine967-C5)-methyltransferase